LERFHRYGRK
jgi:hypothetical protein